MEALNFMERVQLKCLNCSKVLKNTSVNYVCSGCGKKYDFREGVLRFCEAKNDFYEGAYKATINYTSGKNEVLNWLYLYFINTHYLWYIDKYIRPSFSVLDVACGGGIKYISQKCHVTGLDLSFSSLLKTTGFYKMSVQCDALKTPFFDKQFDIIINSYFFEHVPKEKKEAQLKEFYRLLRSKGKLIMLFDCDSKNIFFKYLKKYPDLYNRAIVETDRHYGLEYASENIEKIKSAGFKIIKKRSFNKTPLQYPAVYNWTRVYSEKNKIFNILCKTARFIQRNALLYKLYIIMLTVFDDIVEVFLPLDWGRILLIVAEKKD